MENPIISIVIPCYNHGQYIEETLASIIANTEKYTPEIIIVNDGSSEPNTLEILKNIESKDYFILHQENQGLAKARNNGIKLAKGKYILPLDSDNNVCYNYLNTAIDILEHENNIDIVYGDAKYIGEKNGIWKNNLLNKRRMLVSNHIDACAIYRKETWKKVNGYSEDMPYMGCEDWNFWLKCIDNNLQFYYLNEICFEYRVLKSSMIRNIPDDFNYKINIYNMTQLSHLYISSLKNDSDIFHNIFHGNIFKKMIKLFLNHFNLYKY